MRTRHSRSVPAFSARHDQSPFEALESRRLQSVTTWTAASISDLSSYQYVAQVSMGDNGYPNGMPGAAVAIGGDETGAATVEWDSDLSDGLYSGWRSVAFTLDLGTSASTSWAVDGADTIHTSASSGSANFSSVALRSAVEGADMGIAWQNVVVHFFRGETLIQTVELGGVAADTTGASTNAPQESVIVATVTATNCDRVTFTGSVRLTAAADTYPGAGDIFGQVLIS